MATPFVHETPDGAIRVLNFRNGEKYACNILDERGGRDVGPQTLDLASCTEWFNFSLAYVEKVDPTHKCFERGCRFGI